MIVGTEQQGYYSDLYDFTEQNPMSRQYYIDRYNIPYTREALNTLPHSFWEHISDYLQTLPEKFIWRFDDELGYMIVDRLLL